MWNCLHFFICRQIYRQIFKFVLVQLSRKWAITKIVANIYKNQCHISNFNNKITRGTNFGKTSKNFLKIQVSTIRFKWLIKHLESKLKALKNKMILQNIAVNQTGLFVEWETFLNSVVTDKSFDLDAVNNWEWQSDALVQLEHTLYMAYIYPIDDAVRENAFLC